MGNFRPLAERGHDSVYNRGPASASQSNDQICGAPGGAEGAPGGAEGAPGSGGGPTGGLQRASLEAELRAPRETMVTFSHTLPRAGQGPKEPGSTWQQRATDRRREGGSEAAQGPPAVRRGPGGHGPDAGAPAVSPKSALTRAKWLAITEKNRAPPGPPPGPPGLPRLLQAVPAAGLVGGPRALRLQGPLGVEGLSQ